MTAISYLRTLRKHGYQLLKTPCLSDEDRGQRTARISAVEARSGVGEDVALHLMQGSRKKS